MTATDKEQKNTAGKNYKQKLGIKDWICYGPFLAQVVVTRRCNLKCGYCNEFDTASQPIPFSTIKKRLEKLAQLKTWTACLTGGEPLLNPDILDMADEMLKLGFKRRQIITNGYLINKEIIERLNRGRITDLQISIDGVFPNDITVKTLKPLRKKLQLLSEHADFRVVMSGVIGSSLPEEALEVISFAKKNGFIPRILLLHNEKGKIKLSPEQLTAYKEAKRQIGSASKEAHSYRDRIIKTGKASFKCRAGSRYLYVDEFGKVSWCSQTRDNFSKDILAYNLDDLKEQFYKIKNCNDNCTLGCARTASAVDQWRTQ